MLPVPVVGRLGRSFQDLMVRLPVKLGGFGFRSLEDTATTAFLGALEQAIPFFPGEAGICPMLEDVMGGQDCFGEDAPSDSRWRVLLASGCREGEELQSAWQRLKEEEVRVAGWLGREKSWKV